MLEAFQLDMADLEGEAPEGRVLFQGARRPALVFPENLELGTIDDELHPGRRALRLSFELAKGSYATIMVKRITERAADREGARR